MLASLLVIETVQQLLDPLEQLAVAVVLQQRALLHLASLQLLLELIQRALRLLRGQLQVQQSLLVAPVRHHFACDAV